VHRDEIGQRGKETELDARLSTLESKIEEVKQLLFQNNSVEKNESQRYFDRVVEFSPTYFITFASIIQAAVLGYLLIVIKDQITDISRGIYDPLRAILIAAMFLMIVLIWMNYYAITMLRFTPSTYDALILFCLGLIQAIAIFCIGLQKVGWYYFSIGLVALMALAAYVFGAREAHLDDDNRALLARMDAYVYRAIPLAVVSVLIYFAFGVSEVLFYLNSLFFALFNLASNVFRIFVLHSALNEPLTKYQHNY
jgi:hypothetical protein